MSSDSDMDCQFATTTPTRSKKNAGAGGRPRSNPAWDFFQRDDPKQRARPAAAGGPTAKSSMVYCKVPGCGKAMDSAHGVTNLTRHLTNKHREAWQRAKDEHRRRQAATSSHPEKSQKSHTLNGVNLTIPRVVELFSLSVTVHGRSPDFVDDMAMQFLCETLLAAAPPEEEIKVINSSTLRNYITEQARLCRERVAAECEGRMVYLKIDVDGVAKEGVRFVGISVQLVNQGKLRLLSLGVRRVRPSCTARGLRVVAADTLREYGIGEAQICSTVVDSGSSISMEEVAAVANPPAEAKEEEEEEASVSGDGDSATDSQGDGVDDLEDNDDDDEGDPVDEAHQKELDSNLELTGEDGEDVSLSCTGSAVRALTLAVAESLKSEDAIPLVKLMRRLCRILRTPSSRRQLKAQGLSCPRLDRGTEASSTTAMLESLLPLQDFSLGNVAGKAYGKSKTELALSAEHFKNLRAMLAVLVPVRDAVAKLQHTEQLTMGDFLLTWMEARLNVAKQEGALADALAKQMAVLESALYDSPAFSAAIYLDPRVFVLLEAGAREVAENYIQKVWQRLQDLKRQGSEPQTVEASEPVGEAGEKGLSSLEVILRNAERRKSMRRSSLCVITPMLTDFFELEERLPRETDILEWWESRKLVEPVLYELAQVILAAPASQVSLARFFSEVKFLLSDAVDMARDLQKDVLVIRAHTDVITRRDAKPVVS